MPAENAVVYTAPGWLVCHAEVEFHTVLALPDAQVRGDPSDVDPPGARRSRKGRIIEP